MTASATEPSAELDLWMDRLANVATATSRVFPAAISGVIGTGAAATTSSALLGVAPPPPSDDHATSWRQGRRKRRRTMLH